MQFTLMGSTLSCRSISNAFKMENSTNSRDVEIKSFLNEQKTVERCCFFSNQKVQVSEYFILFIFLTFEVFSFRCSQMWVRGRVPLTPVPAV